MFKVRSNVLAAGTALLVTVGMSGCAWIQEAYTPSTPAAPTAAAPAPAATPAPVTAPAPAAAAAAPAATDSKYVGTWVGKWVVDGTGTLLDEIDLGTNRRDVFTGIQACERATLDVWAEQREREAAQQRN